MKSICRVSILWVPIFLLIPSVKPAYAYLDPGTGSMMVQAVLAVIAAVSVSIGVFWNRIKAILGRMFGGKQGDKRERDE